MGWSRPEGTQKALDLTDFSLYGKIEQVSELRLRNEFTYNN